MKFAFLKLFFILLPALLVAQNQRQIDSAYLLLQHAANDTDRMGAYYLLGGFYDDVNADSGLYFCNKGIAIAEKLDLPLKKAEMLAFMSWPLTKTGNYPEALRVISQGLKIAEDPASEKKTANRLKGQTPQEYRQTVVALLYSALEYLYLFVGDYEKQIEVARKAILHLEIARDSFNLAGIYPDIGDSYLKLNKIDSALFYQQKSLEYYSKLPFEARKFEASTHTSLGAIYEKMGNNDRARESYLNAIRISEQQDNPRHMGNASLQLASLYQTLQKPDSAFIYARKALEAFRQGGYKKEVAIAYRVISDYYHEKNNTDSSFAYLRLATVLDDSLDQIEKAKLQEFQVDAFNQQLVLQQLEQEQIEKQGKLKSMAIIALIVVFSSIGFLLYRNNRQKQKANQVLNSKNKELEIEAALERVRSRSMGMQKSEELKEVIKIVYQQLRQLKINLDHAGFVVDYTPYGDWDYWIADEQDIPTKITHPYFESVWANQFNKAKEKGEDLFVTHLNFEEKNKFYNALLSYVPGLPNVSNNFYLNCPGLAATTVLLDNVALYMENFAGIPFKGEDNNILMRFGKVFQQAYTRFLDLQKSEAQTREAQIEASLERVRNQAMAMHKSDDLLNISMVLYKELKMLGLDEIRNAMILIHDEKNDFFIDYDYSSIGSKITRIPTTGISLIEKYVKELKVNEKSKVNFLELKVSGEELESWKKARKATGQLDDPRLDSIETLYYYHYSIGTGNVSISTFSSLSNKKLEVLERFRNVFQLPYQRYHDIEIAVAQTEQARLNLIQIQTEKKRAEDALTILKATQAQLIQSEKLASLGELTAGIAHEIQNPLNFVNNFSEINIELAAEINDALEKGDLEEVKALTADIRTNQEKIRDHGKRADAIVKGMLQHTRSSSGVKEPTDINALADEYLRLAYHGLRAKDKSFNATIKTDFDQSIGNINIIPQDIGRVLLNLINNAFYAVKEKAGAGKADFEPIVEVSTQREGNHMKLAVRDNGNGIPENIIQKIFQPFFTTKPTGEGTGLGLSLSYDIIKAHGGELKVETKEGEGSTFSIVLPVS